MVSKAWRNFINESLTEIEDISNPEDDIKDSSKETDSLDSESLKDDKKSWCNSIDRSLGYAFKSFCRYVTINTLSECSIRKIYEIGPNEFRSNIDRNFCYIESVKIPPLKNYYKSYRRYARWHNNLVKNKKLFDTRKRCNLSYFRKLCCVQLRKNVKSTPKVDPGRYEMVKPVNKFVNPSLAMAFSKV